jgi:hypothetical protein
MSNPEVGRFDTTQLACPECKEDENLSDVPDDDGGLFSTCHECGYQWHEPPDLRRPT